MALEKNYLAVPYIEEAKTLRLFANKVKFPKDLLNLDELRVGLLTASGLSDKSLNYLTEEDKTLAIKGLIEEFLEPAGANFIDDLSIGICSPKAMLWVERPAIWRVR